MFPLTFVIQPTSKSLYLLMIQHFFRDLFARTFNSLKLASTSNSCAQDQLKKTHNILTTSFVCYFIFYNYTRYIKHTSQNTCKIKHTSQNTFTKIKYYLTHNPKYNTNIFASGHIFFSFHDNSTIKHYIIC